MLKKEVKMIKIMIILLSSIVLFGCRSELKPINSVDDLENSNVGIYTASEYDKIIQNRLQNVQTSYYSSYSDQVSALLSGKIDGFLTDEPLAKEILKNNDQLKVLDELLTHDSYAFAMSPDLKNLKKDIDEVLIKMEQEGIYKNFEEKWMGNDEEKKELEKYDSRNKKKTIKFATVASVAPFSYIKNNQIVGYDIDIIGYVCNELGYKLEVIDMSFDGVIPALISKKVDMAGSSIIVTEERLKSVLFTHPDYTGGIVVVTRK